jgi:hypothetical protein
MIFQMSPPKMFLGAPIALTLCSISSSSNDKSDDSSELLHVSSSSEFVIGLFGSVIVGSLSCQAIGHVVVTGAGSLPNTAGPRAQPASRSGVGRREVGAGADYPYIGDFIFKSS